MVRLCFSGSIVCALVFASGACGKRDDNKPTARKAQQPVAASKRSASNQPPKPLQIAAATTQTRETCPPLLVTLDGKPLLLSHGLAKNVYGTPSIFLYGQPVECDAFMNSEIATYDVPHISVGIGLRKKGRVSVGSSRGGTALVNYVTLPDKVGDTMALCVPTAVEFVPLHPTMKGRLRVQGLIEGKHCGDRTRDH